MRERAHPELEHDRRHNTAGRGDASTTGDCGHDDGEDSDRPE